MYLQSLRTNLYDLHWESEAEKKSGDGNGFSSVGGFGEL